jgi:hypothetical protein
MEKTSLELYETAYKLHYIEKKINDAVKIYEALIREFPDSNECGYAVIQLQKIKSSNLSEQIRKQKNSIYTFAVAAFILACISIFACGGIMYYFKSQIKIEQAKTAQTISALGKIINGDYDEALQYLSELKNIDKENIIPVELSAEIYRKKMQYKKALDEYESYYRINPLRQPSGIERSIMENCKAQASNSVRNVRSLKIEKEETPAVAIVTREKTPDIKKIAPVNEIQSQEINKSKKIRASVSEGVTPINNVTPKAVQKDKASGDAQSKDLFVVDPDSLSYF